ncbi:MAG: septal ring lytic transglycosylase RlpA family protein [Thermoanaerobaculia bacterium]|nr:septal ring lytic transglycosylase RlpA family protein [Thermoanaerobaculia bacterium]
MNETAARRAIGAQWNCRCRAPFTFREIFSSPLLILFLLTACSSQPPAKTAATSSGGEKGLASWYGKEFDGLPTASGETFRPEKVSAAHRTLPLGTVVDVTNERNGRTVRVRINDRGPFVAGRIVDLSKAAAQEIGSVGDGVVPVTLRVVTLGDNSRIRAGSDEPPSVTAANTADTSTAAASPRAGAWAVQAGAFGDEANAVRLRDRLAARYPNPYIEEFQGLKRVKFGPYGTRGEAEAARESLGEMGLAGIVVVYR